MQSWLSYSCLTLPPGTGDSRTILPLLPFFQAGISPAAKRARSFGSCHTHSYKNQPPLQLPTNIFRVRGLSVRWTNANEAGDIEAGAQPSHSRTMPISQRTQVAQVVHVQVSSSPEVGG